MTQTSGGPDLKQKALLTAWRELAPDEREKLLRLLRAKAVLAPWLSRADAASLRRGGTPPIIAVPKFDFDMPAPQEVNEVLCRIITERLPTDLPPDRRDSLAREAAKAGAEVLPRVQRNYNERNDALARQNRANILNAAIDMLIIALDDADGAAAIMEAYSELALLPGGERGEAFRVVKGLWSVEEVRHLRDVARELRIVPDALLNRGRLPITSPKVPNVRVLDAASHFDLAIARTLEGALKRRLLARLISELRTATDLPHATPPAIEQRLRDQGIR
jgi:hypothetical protein